MRTPTAYCASTSPKVQTSASIAVTTLKPSLKRLIPDLEKRLIGRPLQKHSTFSYYHFRNVLRRPIEFTQYASYAFRAELNANNITQSMSGRGNCYDNAVVESFFATLKTEEVEGASYQTRQQAKTSIFSYLEGFYNTRRRHSSLGYLSPNDFETVHFAKAA